MKRKIIVIAPHPDDETLGCGGTILRHRDAGDEVHWLIVTAMAAAQGFSIERIAAREAEIDAVAHRYRFASVNRLMFPATRLDVIPMGDLVRAIGEVLAKISPEIVYLPFRGDVHTDHAMVSDATLSCLKWFRLASVRRILAYETLSETEFGINPDSLGFRPNVFMDVHAHLSEKSEILGIFADEIRAFPFPRSIDAVRALALLRGATAGCGAAEAFMLLKEII